jgi:hypothetical protein
MAGNFGADFRNKALLHFLQNADIATIGDATGVRGSTVAGSLFISGHTADPTAGTQTTSELSYTGYSRATIARSAAGWSVVTATGDNVAAVSLGKRTDGGAAQVLTHIAIGAATSGASLILWVIPLYSSLSITLNVTPTFAIGDLNATLT